MSIKLLPGMLRVTALFASSTLLLAAPSDGRRHLQQALVVGQSSVTAPPGTSMLFQFHGIGTQNYTAQADSSYKNMGAEADLYSGRELRAHHFFNEQGVPTFEMVDAASGASQGTVTGKVVAMANPERQADDGGFGSVASLLLVAQDGKGTLADCSYVLRKNTLGGVAPTGLHALPAYDGIPNFQLAMPYQADYVFLSGGVPYNEGGRRRMAGFQRHLHHPKTRQ